MSEVTNPTISMQPPTLPVGDEKKPNSRTLLVTCAVALGVLVGLGLFFSLAIAIPVGVALGFAVTGGLLAPGLVVCAKENKGVKDTPPTDPIVAIARDVVIATPKFRSYKFGATDVVLTDLYVRPSNLFFNALFEGTGANVTQPGGDLFAFNKPLAEVGAILDSMSDDKVVRVCAGTKTSEVCKEVQIRKRGDKYYREIKSENEPLTKYLGEETFSISVNELRNSLASQTVSLSPMIPKSFYLGLKAAMDADEIVTLPTLDENPMLLQDFCTRADSAMKTYLEAVTVNPLNYGFSPSTKDQIPFEKLLNMTIYQIGSMVVKKEQFHCFVGDGYKIRQRDVGADDSLILVSACGIRGFGSGKTTSVSGNSHHELDIKIMTHTFKLGLEAAGSDGYVVFPAVGMGVWKGHPEVYWTAFFDAVLELDEPPAGIFVNPGHQQTRGGKNSGKKGEEFKTFLEKYKKNHPNNPNLSKVVNLFDDGTDLLLLAQNLKLAHPSKNVAIFNASDPDVTLGNHVGEYTNNIHHTSTTEENFAAVTTSGLTFEALTKVRCEVGTPRVIEAG